MCPVRVEYAEKTAKTAKTTKAKVKIVIESAISKVCVDRINQN